MEKERKSYVEHAQNLADIDKNVEYLNVNKNNLSHLRKKIKDLKEDYEQLMQTVNRCELFCVVDSVTQEEALCQFKKMYALQETISDLHVYRYQECEQSLKYHIENDMLKLKEAENHRKIQILLALCGLNEPEFNVLMGAAEVKFEGLPFSLQKYKDVLQPNWDKIQAVPQLESAKSTSVDRGSQILLAELREQKEMHDEQLQILYEDRDLQAKERLAEQEHFLQTNSRLLKRLKDTQKELCEVTKKLIKVKEQHCAKELSWETLRQNLSERLCFYQNHLRNTGWATSEYHCEKSEKPESKKSRHNAEQLQESYSCRSSQHVSGTGITTKTMKSNKKRGLILDPLKKEKLLVKYQENILQLEVENAKLHEEVYGSKEKVKKLMAQITLLKNKNKQLDTRRLLEAEGFQNKIKILEKEVEMLQKCFHKYKKGQSQTEIEEALREQVRSFLVLRDSAIRNLQHVQNKVDILIEESQKKKATENT